VGSSPAESRVSVMRITSMIKRIVLDMSGLIRRRIHIKVKIEDDVIFDSRQQELKWLVIDEGKEYNVTVVIEGIERKSKDIIMHGRMRLLQSNNSINIRIEVDKVKPKRPSHDLKAILEEESGGIITISFK
jgi:hypothetical protein